MSFTPSTLKKNQDGDPGQFFAKLTGFGYNDMISLPTLTKESILDNLKRRFKVLQPTACAQPTGRLPISQPGKSKSAGPVETRRACYDKACLLSEYMRVKEALTLGPIP